MLRAIGIVQADVSDLLPLHVGPGGVVDQVQLVELAADTDSLRGIRRRLVAMRNRRFAVEANLTVDLEQQTIDDLPPAK